MVDPALLWVALLGVAQAEPCPVFSRVVANVELAWAHMDRERFTALTDDLDRAVDCSEGTLFPDDIADVFRARALRQFLDGDRAALDASLSALAASSDRDAFPSHLVPEDHPIARRFRQIQARPKAAPEALPRAGDGWIHVNGIRTTLAPSDRPWLFQRFDEHGQVVETALVEAGEPPPAYPIIGGGTVVAARRFRHALSLGPRPIGLSIRYHRGGERVSATIGVYGSALPATGFGVNATPNDPFEWRLGGDLGLDLDTSGRGYDGAYVGARSGYARMRQASGVADIFGGVVAGHRVRLASGSWAFAAGAGVLLHHWILREHDTTTLPLPALELRIGPIL